jgi:4-amino-4-deoxy-L-arabinose transferase-like glycosyltransferase
LTSVNENKAHSCACETAVEVEPAGNPEHAGWPLATIFAVTVIVALNLACYYRSLSGYFLADDFIHIPFLAEVFRGHPELLLKNFTSNWMQTEGTQFYRPLISITLAIDYAFWHVNALGYHLTNLIYQTAASIFLFLLSRRIYKSFAIGFFAGALFAVFPLHPEVASWVIARVDGVATAFYLAAFWLFLRCERAPQNLWSRRLSYICFTLSLLSKETAITLPAALAAYVFFFAPASGLKNRLRCAIVTTRYYWLLLVVYLIVRTASLGTFTGGYKGSIGAGLSQSFMHRVFGDGSALRVLYPLNADVFAGGDKTKRYLRLLYEIGAGVVLLRTIACARGGRIATWLRDLAFPLAWFVIAMVPAYQVFNLTNTLQGSRFIYMATAPLCLLFAILLAPLGAVSQKVGAKLKWTTNSACVLALLVLIALFGVIAWRNNDPWVQAGIGVRALKESMERELSAAGQRHIALLNLPQRYRGAHMLYNGAMFSILMSPPLCSADYSHRIATFEPVMFGESDLLNTTRLKRLLSPGEKYLAYRWEQTDQKAEPVNLTLSTGAIHQSISGQHDIDDKHPFVSQSLSIAPLSVDLAEVNLTVTNPVKDAVLMLQWTTPYDSSFSNDRTLYLPLKQTTAPQAVTFSLSDRKRWVASELIDKIKLSLPAKGSAVRLLSVVAESGERQIPALALQLAERNSAGDSPHEDEFGVTWSGSVIGPIAFDVSKIPAASSAIYELTKRDCWFDHYSGVSRERQLAPEVLERGKLADGKLSSADAEVKPHGISQAGYYEFRIFAADKNGKPIGYCSDPINLWLEPPRKSGVKPANRGAKQTADRRGAGA